MNETATTDIYTLSLHDALPIWLRVGLTSLVIHAAMIGAVVYATLHAAPIIAERRGGLRTPPDRKSTRLNSSHVKILYAVFRLKKKNIENPHNIKLLAARLTHAQ